MKLNVRGSYSIVTQNKDTGENIPDKCFDVNNTVTLEGRDWFTMFGTLTNNGRNNVGTGTGTSHYARIFYSDGSSSNLRDITQVVAIAFATGTTEVLEDSVGLSGTVRKGTSTINISTAGVRDEVNGTFTYQIKFRHIYSPGSITGTYGQVGLYASKKGSANSWETLVAGQQLKDVEGNPITVTFLDTEEVTVYYSLYYTVPYNPLTISYNPTDFGELPVVYSDSIVLNGAEYPYKIHNSGLYTYANQHQPADGYTANRQYATPFYSRNGGVSAYNVLVYFYDDASHTELKVYGMSGSDWNASHLPAGYNQFATNIEIIERGILYKEKFPLFFPYTFLSNKHIKGIVIGAERISNGTINTVPNINNYPFASIAGPTSSPNGPPPRCILWFDTPIHKGPGDELTLEPFILYGFE